MKGFFDPADLQPSRRQPLQLLANCSECKLDKGCRSPKMAVSGKGQKKILVVGEAPGSQEDSQGKPFVGPTGEFLREVLAENGVDMRRDCWLTNSAICHPKRNKLPPKAPDHCRPNLVRAVNELKPERVILLGGSAVRSLIGWLWKDDPGAISRWVGWRIPSRRLNAWVCPTWHPSAILRGSNDDGRTDDVMELQFRKHVAAACRLNGRPDAPESSPVTVMMNDDSLRTIERLAIGTKPVAFDFETDRLKPDHKEARIVCCALSDGETTIAYPWNRMTEMTTHMLLAADVPKIGYNCKFEDRWTRKILPKGRVFNWAWCGMLAAHVLDNRSGISGLKFQSFALLGVESWNDEIEPYLKAKGSNERNRIHELPIEKVLLYCGLDALHEWQVAHAQAAAMGVTIG